MGAFRDWGTAIVTSLANTLGLVLTFIPRLVGFLVILLIGWIIASLLARAATIILRRAGFDRMADRIGLSRFEQRMGIRMDPANVLGRIVYWFVFLVFLVPAVDALGLNTVTALLDQVIGYLPNVFVAILVLLVGAVIANFIADVTRNALSASNVRDPGLISNIVRYAITGFVVLVALYQLQIAPAMIQTLFTAIIGAVALALALAFGLGGTETARRYLDRGQARITGISPVGSQESALDTAPLRSVPPPLTQQGQVRSDQPLPDRTRVERDARVRERQ
jgi:small-conductance mechanosensitive channel